MPNLGHSLGGGEEVGGPSWLLVTLSSVFFKPFLRCYDFINFGDLKQKL